MAPAPRYFAFAVFARPVSFSGGGVLMGVGIALTLLSPSSWLLSGGWWPPEKRSWSFGIATAASSMGQFVFAPLGHLFIAAYRLAERASSAGRCSMLPMIVCRPSVGAAPRACAGRRGGEPRIPVARPSSGPSARELVLLMPGFFVCGFQIAFVSVHLPAIPSSAASSLACRGRNRIVGVFNVIGSYMAGIIAAMPKPSWLSLIYLAAFDCRDPVHTMPVTPPRRCCSPPPRASCGCRPCRSPWRASR